MKRVYNKKEESFHGYPKSFEDYVKDGWVLEWGIDYSSIAIIPYKEGWRFVRLVYNPIYHTKSKSPPRQLVCISGILAVTDMLVKKGWSLGEINHLEKFLKPQKYTHWAGGLPDIHIKGKRIDHYYEVKTKVIFDDYIKHRDSICIDKRRGEKYKIYDRYAQLFLNQKGKWELLVVGLRRLEIKSNYNLVFWVDNILVLPLELGKSLSIDYHKILDWGGSVFGGGFPFDSLGDYSMVEIEERLRGV